MTFVVCPSFFYMFVFLAYCIPSMFDPDVLQSFLGKFLCVRM